MTKRRRSDMDNATARRSKNACHRCRNKKLKCHFGDGSQQVTCVACIKSGADCVFDVSPDGIPRGAEYVASLGSRIVSLEEQLRRASEGSFTVGEANRSNALLEGPEARFYGVTNSNSRRTTDRSAAFRAVPNGPVQTQHKVIESASDGVTIFNFLSHPPIPSESECSAFPSLPTEALANDLLETTYKYTQGRYCLVDWAQVREWHQNRENICKPTRANDQEAQTGAYFIWMVYAIGAQLTSSPQSSPAEYYTRALKSLPVILSQQNITTVQALLILIQYFYRSPGGPSIWHLAGAVMRLCVELGMHRKAAAATGTAAEDPYRTELRKRLFWCAYCFDRSVSILSKRPFGIQDTDIDVEFPVDIDVMCLDREVLWDRQAIQSAGGSNSPGAGTSSITASLHHLRMYRLQSRIISSFSGPNASLLTSEEALKFLRELDEWRTQVFQESYPPNFPQQSDESWQAAYYMTALLLLRPTLARPSIDKDLLQRCASLSAEACENEKAFCFSPQNHNSPVRIYNCFRCGLTLLQCLAIRPTILPARTALRAINSCSSALSVYAGALTVARPYLQLFDKLSDYFFGYDDGALCRPDDNLRSLLHRVTSCDPSQIPELLKSLSAEEALRNTTGRTPNADLVGHADASREAYPAPTLGMDLVTPFEILDDSLRPDLFQEDMMGFWGGFFT